MSSKEVFMAFPQPQHDVTFLQRTQRFLASVEFADGTQELVYCANSGAMVGDLSAGLRALIWDSGDLTRKRRFTWRAIESEGLWIGTDTHLANRIVEEALRQRLVHGLENYDTIVREATIEPGVRVDFLIAGAGGECLVEVKSSNIVKNGVAQYPDSPTPRGVKQLKALARTAAAGRRSVLLFLVQRSDAQRFQVRLSRGCDYSQALKVAVAAGVEIISMAVSVHPEGFRRPRLLPFEFKVDETQNSSVTQAPSVATKRLKNRKSRDG
jgi:sugar fermentation stimulation protein A